jgi:hypothetical protein
VANGHRRERILRRVLAGGSELETQRLCEVCAEVTGVSGAGIMLMYGDVLQGSICTSDEVSALIEDLQSSLGEGPGIDACHDDRPVLEADLCHPSSARWLAFSGPAIKAGVKAVFAFPLQVGSVRLGALNLHRDQAGPLNDEQYADALVLANLAAQSILLLQANAPPGKLAAELESGSDLRFVVHQASGMVAAQLDVSVGQALVRLRAYAFGNDYPLTEVAKDVVSRKLRFDARSGERDLIP